MGMHGGGPQPDAFTLSDIGRVRRVGFRRRPIALDRLDDGRWIEIDRVLDEDQARLALDAAAGQGVPVDHLRLRVVSRPADRILPIALIVFVVAVAALLFALLAR
ncbi:MAG: hypothetical protein ACXWZU_09510 [Actinomycetota bacterium]